MQRAICWLRRDLRLSDHAALAAATSAAERVALVFVFDRNILDALEDRDDRRVTFIHQSLQEIDEKLRPLGSHLVVAHGDPVEEIPRIAREFEAEMVFAGRDYDPYATRRDAEVGRRLAAGGARLSEVRDIVIFEPNELRTQAGTPFTVFTPFMKAWRKAFEPERAGAHDPDLSRLAPSDHLSPGIEWSLPNIGFGPASLWLEPGESGAKTALQAFLPRLSAYAENRNFPAMEATSGLSVHLRFGTVSIRECVRLAFGDSSEGAQSWLNELIWREFYQMILAEFPHVVGRAFKPEYDAIEWPGTEEHFIAWCEGRTGYPIVDAAMRCLNETGWMHNRLRMIVASFLVKDLLVDWRKGEAYFARRLLDFELASNNGGWQWSASTGCDAQPYFRIFNPWLQSVKFDGDGAFIRKWCPELAGYSNEAIHAPSRVSEFDQLAAGCRIGENYPSPLVDHDLQKGLALRLLEGVRTTP